MPWVRTPSRVLNQCNGRQALVRARVDHPGWDDLHIVDQDVSPCGQGSPKIHIEARDTRPTGQGDRAALDREGRVGVGGDVAVDKHVIVVGGSQLKGANRRVYPVAFARASDGDGQRPTGADPGRAGNQRTARGDHRIVERDVAARTGKHYRALGELKPGGAKWIGAGVKTDELASFGDEGGVAQAGARASDNRILPAPLDDRRRG